MGEDLDRCECWVPEKYWLSAASCGYGSGYEPGSQMEYNPECPVHATAFTPRPPTHPAGDEGTTT